jgi:transposase
VKYAGIDWATDVHFVALLDGEGEILDEWQVRHEAAAVQELVARLAHEGGPEEILVAVESGAPLVTDVLLEAGYRVYAINPKQADRFRDRHTTAGAKDDRRDALVLADAVRTDKARLSPLERDSALTEELRLRDRARSRLVAQRTRYSNQLRQVLARYYPALLQLGRDMHDRFFLVLLRAYPDSRAGRHARMPRLQSLLEEHRIRALTVEELRNVLRGPSFSVADHVAAACRDEALDLADQIELLNEQILKADRRLRELFEKHPDRELLLSLPGLGDCLAIRVAAELGDHRARDGDPTSLQAFAGTAPVTKRSGKRGVMSISMRRGCNRILQAALFHMARCSVGRSSWARAYLRHLRRRGIPHARAVRALSNKWAKILAAILHTRSPYDEAIHVRHLEKNKIPWILEMEAEKLGPRRIPA